MLIILTLTTLCLALLIEAYGIHDESIAIDFGYTYVSAAVLNITSDKPVFIRSESGVRRAPNYIAFNEENDVLFWEAAKKYALHDAKVIIKH